MSFFREARDEIAAYESVAVANALISDALNPGFSEFERRGLEGAYGTAVTGRTFLVLVISLFAVWIAIADPAWWRRGILATTVLALIVLDISTRIRFRRHGVEQDGVRVNLAAMMSLQVAMIFATGGLISPVLPALLPSAFMAGLLADRWGIRYLVLGLQVPALIMLTLIQATNLYPSLVPVPFQSDGELGVIRLFVAGAVAAALASVLGMFGSRLRREARRNLEQLQTAQEAALGEHRQRADDLTLMSGEIAHELKNPLASVKGLTQLLSRSVGGGDTKTKERLEVLGREVARMQDILEEFLNFSRPLTPLTRTAVDVEEVCNDVLSLHEAMAASLSVTLHSEIDDDLVVEGDSRKIGQVLVNLLQNALETAPPESEVWVYARDSGPAVLLEVHDSGEGLPDAEIEIFEPGITTKADGNGLGLTIARAIAQQHEGSLTLEDRSEGGCVARFTIPKEAA